MNSEQVERLIKNLGCSYDALIANGVIDNLPLQDLYEDGESLEVEPAPGIELIFWPETLRFEGIYVTLKTDQSLEERAFCGDLPGNFGSVFNQLQVHESFGEPIISKGILELQGTGLGGWDTYQLESNLHPAALVDFQYSANYRLSRIFFSLIDRNI